MPIISLEVMAAVLGAALLHATWNATLKGAADPRTASVFMTFGSAVVLLPLLLVVPAADPAAWPYVIASGVVHVAYWEFLGRAYRKADLSVAYPMMRGGGALLTTLVGGLLLGDALTLPALMAVGLVGIGIVGLGSEALLRRGLDRRTGVLIVTMMAIVTTYTLIDGRGARISGSPIAYLALSSTLTALLFVPLVWRDYAREPLGLIRRHGPRGLLAGGLASAGYGIALWAMTKAPIGVVAALRETSVLFALLIGAVLFRERIGPVRLASAGVIVAGIVALRLA